MRPRRCAHPEAGLSVAQFVHARYAPRHENHELALEPELKALQRVVRIVRFLIMLRDPRPAQREFGTHRIGLVGDVHAEDALLEVTLGFYWQNGIRTIVCTGDVMDGWGDAERCCRLLRQYSVATVLGNHDEWYLNGQSRDLPEATPMGSLSTQSQAFVATLPRTLWYATAFGSVILCHGLGENNDASVEKSDEGDAITNNRELQDLIADPRVQIVMNGHTHEAVVRHFAGLTIVNAGSLHRDYEPVFLIVDFGTGAIDVLPVRDANIGTPLRLGELLPSREMDQHRSL